VASLDEHCQDCIRELGEPFRAVHLWLDAFFETKGARHRIMRHHSEGVEEVRQLWGDRSAAAAQIHIAKDWLGTIPTKEQVVMWYAASHQ
jgi:hypothetical protein